MSKKNQKQQRNDAPETPNANKTSNLTEIPEDLPVRTLLGKIREQRKISARSLEDVPSLMRPAFAIAKNNAADLLRSLEADYRKFVEDNLVVLHLRGDRDVVFRTAIDAKAQGPAVMLDTNGLYKRLALVVEQSMTPSREFDTPQFLRLVEALVSVASEFGVSDMPRPRFKAFKIAPGDDLTKAVREMVDATFGDSLNLLALRKSLFEQALDEGYTTAVPVVVIGEVSNDLRRNLFPTARATEVSVDGDSATSTLDQVAEAFERLMS